MSRNLVAPETAEFNRRECHGRRTFNAPLGEGAEGIAFAFAAVRIGEHAHVHVDSGRAVPHPGEGSRPPRGFAGKLVLRWPEWEVLREVLAADERFHVAEVERPTPAQARLYAGQRPG